jgi:hypothetical protein
MILNEWLTKIKQWWAGMLERGEELPPVEQPPVEQPPVEQPPVEQPETTVDPVLENIKKKSRSSAQPTKKPKSPRKKKKTSDKS